MCNLNSEFNQFFDTLSVESSTVAKMRKSRENIRDIIRSYFKNNHPELVPRFYIQGSYAMGTSIDSEEHECDIDDGCYFLPKPEVSSNTLQKWVQKAVENVTDAAPIHKNKCIRVEYKAGYHIDIPVYGMNENDIPQLATRDSGYTKSDPKQIVEWFAKEKKSNPQLVRLVKYLKVWSHEKKLTKLPGLALTVLAANCAEKNERDDISLYYTMKRIYSYLECSFVCDVPGEPFDNIFDGYTMDQKNKIFGELEAFIGNAEKALATEDASLASKYWRKCFGDSFPLVVTDEKKRTRLEKLRKVASSVTSGLAYTSSSGAINLVEGVKNLAHRNYGELLE